MTDTIELLMDAAETGLRKRGYNAVSFRELADELGIKSSSVHYYFRKKEDLGLALIHRYSIRFFKMLDERAAGLEDADARFHAFCEVYRLALVQSDSLCLCGVLGAESGGLPAPLAEGVNAFFQANVDWLEKSFPANWPKSAKRARAFQCVATLQGAMMLANSLNDNEAFDRCVQNLSSDLFGE